MTKRRIRVSGFTRGRDKYTDAQVAALIEDLDLVPALLITPELVKHYRIEVHEQLSNKLAERESVRRAIEYCELFLQSYEGVKLTEKYNEKFNFMIPFNR